MPKPPDKRKRFCPPKQIGEFSPALSCWLSPPDEETARALEVACPICKQERGLPCFRERSRLFRGIVMLHRPHWQRIRLATGAARSI